MQTLVCEVLVCVREICGIIYAWSSVSLRFLDCQDRTVFGPAGLRTPWCRSEVTSTYCSVCWVVSMAFLDPVLTS